MSADEFWKDDPQLFVSYRTSFLNKKKREMEELDYKCWLSGLYNYDGNARIGARISHTIISGFSGLGGKKVENEDFGTYPQKPYNEQKQEKEETNKNNKYKNYHNSLLYYGSIKQIYEDKMTKGE